MERRDFLKNVAWGSVAAATGLIGHGHSAQASDWFRAYRIARPTTPWLLGVESVFQDSLEAELTPEHGTLPEGLRGTFYRNGPALFERGGRRYRHWFDGDGMVHSFRLDGDGLRHKGRFVATQKRREEAAAADFRYEAFGTKWPDMAEPSSRAPLNSANINVLPHGGKLLALWEGGSPYEIDPASLETKGPLAYSPELEAVPFSAHPVVEADGTLWNFGMANQSRQLILYEISPRQELKRVQTLALDRARFIHDFTTTQRYLVFLMPPMVYDHDLRLAGAPFIYAHRWEPERGIQALVVDKQDFSRVRRFTLPAGFIFHFAGAWNDSDGTVHVEADIYDDARVATDYASRMMRGEGLAEANFWAKPTRVTLPPSERGEPDLARLADNGEFPRIHPGRDGRRYRYSYSGCRMGQPNHPFLDGLQRIDRDSGKVERYRFADNVIVEEHIPVPKPGTDSEDAVWLMGTHLDLKDECTKLAVFEGSRLSDGPIWQARLPYALPMGLHGNFAAA